MSWKKYLFVTFLSLLFLPGVSLANRGKIKILEKLETEKAPPDKMKSEVPGKWERHNQMIDLVEAGYLSRIQDLAYKIGNNQNLEIDQDAANSMKNFILSASFHCIPDELPDGYKNEDRPGIMASYYFVYYFELSDPYTNEIIGMYKVDAKYTSATRLSANEQAELALKLLDDPGIPNIDQIEADIKAKADYTSAKIIYNQPGQVANGDNKGMITVSGIRNDVIGEAKSNPISGFELRCEKGKFTKTNSKKVRFEGNEYFHNGPNKISFEYETYRCSDYDDDKNHDKFTLVQISQLSGAIDEKVVQEQEFDFTCGGYDVYAHYYAEGFADVEVVWRNVQIVIPDDESDIAVLDANGDYEGENIPVPYAVNIPGYGKEIYYSWTENEYEIPEEIKMKSLVKNTVCWIDKTEDGLNSCSVEKIPGGSIQLVLQFDLYIGEAVGEGEQITVGTDSEFPNAQTFPWLKMESSIIEKLKASQEVEKTLTNQSGGHLKIHFKPL
ncbi:MAG: hypothetical protein EOM73_06490 [Bacteroidia bacterium]|nr:hypothetical protein [Bacteroidia bacterium]